LQATHASRSEDTPKYLICQDFHTNAPPRLPHWVIRLKTLAFRANGQAKESRSDVRAALYRQKDSAMNTLLTSGFAWVVDEIDRVPHDPDPVLGVAFAGGGRLHIKVSCLDLTAFRVVRQQLNQTTKRT
jgi:hypothetical protein